MVSPLRTQARNRVNQTFSGVDSALRDKFLSSGGGASGKFGRAATQTELARRGALVNSDADFDRMILELQDRGAGLSERLLGMNFGEEFSGSSSNATANSSSSSGFGVAPGSALGSALGGGLDAVSTLYLIDRMLKGGG